METTLIISVQGNGEAFYSSCLLIDMIEAATAQIRINLKSPCKLRTLHMRVREWFRKGTLELLLAQTCWNLSLHSLLRRQSHFLPLQCQLLRC